MSIVSEALKKIQEERSATMGDVGGKINGNAPRVPLSKIPSSHKRRSTVSRILAVMVIAGIFVFAGYVFFEQKENFHKESPVSVEQDTKENGKGVTALLSEKKNTGAYLIKSPLPKLSGIMYTSPDPQSIINGRVVREGDTVSDYLVVKISPDSVKISRNDEELELKL